MYNGLLSSIFHKHKAIYDSSTTVSDQILRLRAEFNIADDSLIMLCPMGLGDTYLACSLSDHLIDKYNTKNLVVFTKSSHLFIPSLFRKETVAYGIPKWLDTNNLKNLLPLPNLFVYAHFQTSEATNLLGYKGLTLIDAYKALFGLPQDTKPAYPRNLITSVHLENANNFLLNNNLAKGKTVILAPEAISTDTFKLEFWEVLSKKLMSNGWQVILNSSNNSNLVIPHHANSSRLDIETIPALAQQAGWMISIRSGLCDVLSTKNSKLTVLYPHGVWLGGSMLEATGLHNMNLKTNAEEIELNDLGSIPKKLLTRYP